MNLKNVVFEELKQRIHERSIDLVIWSGAGLSVRAGLPVWNELQRRMVQSFLEGCEPESKAASETKCLRIRQIRDNWAAFSELKKLFGDGLFNSLIRKELRSPQVVPPIYGKLWMLQPKGMITVNIDRCAGRSLAKLDQDSLPTEFDGFSLARYMHLLSGTKPFVVNLHGQVDDQTTWVFTREQLSDLRGQDSYKHFLSNIFGSFTLLFVGISADDIAVGGFLYHMVNDLGLNLSNHYWITDSLSFEAEEWANKSKVNVIPYAAGKHDELDLYIDDILKSTSVDQDAPPVTLGRTGKTFSDGEISSEHNPNQLRIMLNSRAAELIESVNDTSYQAFFDFIKKFDLKCYNAWFVGESDEERELFGYQLEEKIGTGAFGTVYRARRESETYAIKILHPEVRKQPEKLKSFRRGVRSLGYLNDANIPGIVQIFEATEIPSMLVMELVNGPDLRELKSTQACSDWQTLFRVMLALCQILRRAHNLPQCVLHRDLKPSNILFRDYYINGEIDLVVCDFDFAWHKDAVEDDIDRKAGSFVAPEQVDKNYRTSTRSSLVDSYSVGMILFFLVSEELPSFKNHLMTGWQESVFQSAVDFDRQKWKCIAPRVADLIIKMTTDKQESRVDISTAFNELRRLQELIETERTNFVEIVAEELIARVATDLRYQRRRGDFVIELHSGLELSLGYSESTSRLHIVVSYVDKGNADFRNVRRQLQERIDKAKAILRGLDFKIVSDVLSAEDFRIEAINDDPFQLIGNSKDSQKLSELKYLFQF